MNSSLRAANRSLLLSTILMLIFGLAYVSAMPSKNQPAGIAQAGRSDAGSARNRVVKATSSKDGLTTRTKVESASNQTHESGQARQNPSTVIPHESTTETRQPSTHSQVRTRVPANQSAPNQFASNARRPSVPHQQQSITRSTPHNHVRAGNAHPSTGAVLKGVLEPVETTTAVRPVREFDDLIRRRRIQFNPLPTLPAERSSSSSRLEARLASMETKLTQLAQSQGQTPQPSQASQLLQQLQQSAQQLQQAAQIQNITNELNKLRDKAIGATGATGEKNAITVESMAPAQGGTKPAPVIKVLPAKGNKFESVTFSEAEITQALSMLGELSGLNVIPGKGVEGTVTANLQDVTVEEALDAILRSHDLFYERDGDFVFVMTSTQMEARKNIDRKIVTRVFLPHYVKATTILPLVSAMITKEIGFIAANDANEVGISRDAENAGGDNMSQGDALVVRDYEDIVEEIAKVVQEMDVPPMQVVIEAMILSVSLVDTMEFGVNFALLNDAQSELITSGNGATVNATTGFPTANDQNIIPPTGEFLAATAGLKYGLIRKDVAGFIQALETIADTNLIAAPQLRVLNKQKAELIIGERISYRTLTFNGTQTVENVNFLDVGTKLLLRPFMSPDGLIRMEIHPERSSATIDQATGLPNQTTTEVTTNVMVPNGQTVVIGGLIEEQLSESMEKVPLLGSLPLVGPIFRNKDERIVRTELIILLTPRIVDENETALEGAEGRAAFLDREKHFNEHLAPVNRTNLVRVQRQRAQLYYDRGDYRKALYFVNEALRNGKNDLQSLKLKRQIEEALDDRKLKWLHWPPRNEFVDSKTKNDSTNDEEFLRPTKAEAK